MLQKVKTYFNGSMEPEPDNRHSAQDTDLSIAAKTFNTMGIIAIAVSLVSLPVFGFHITILLFGILFIGLSILLKSQEDILKRLDDLTDNKNEEA
jgi:hypothetical protein